MVPGLGHGLSVRSWIVIAGLLEGPEAKAKASFCRDWRRDFPPVSALGLGLGGRRNSYAPRMKPGKVHVTRTGRKWSSSQQRNVYRCAAEACVGERTARGVLYQDWEINSNPRERAYRWGVSNKVIVTKRDAPANAPSTASQFRTDDLTPPERAIVRAKAAVEAARVSGPESDALFDATYKSALAQFRADASRDFARIVEKLEASADSTEGGLDG